MDMRIVVNKPPYDFSSRHLCWDSLTDGFTALFTMQGPEVSLRSHTVSVTRPLRRTAVLSVLQYHGSRYTGFITCYGLKNSPSILLNPPRLVFEYVRSSGLVIDPGGFRSLLCTAFHTIRTYASCCPPCCAVMTPAVNPSPRPLVLG